MTKPITDIREHGAVGKLSQPVEIDVRVCERINNDHDWFLFSVSSVPYLSKGHKAVARRPLASETISQEIVQP
jgi:hypothetical protein